MLIFIIIYRHQSTGGFFDLCYIMSWYYVVFDESTYKHLDLFEKKVDVNLKSAVKIELDNETIIINYKNEDYQFIDSTACSALNSVYVYRGLQKALYRFIIITDEVDIDEIEISTDGLDMELYQLMKSKIIKS